MYQIPWKTKGIVLTAPQPYKNEIHDAAQFIEKILAPSGVNLIVLQTRYRYQFRRHPECMGFDPLSFEDVKTLLKVCRENGIRLVPKMNLFGHQSGVHNTPSDGILHGLASGSLDFPDGLIRAYPMFSEPFGGMEFVYSKHICPTHPLLPSILFDLMDELIDVFEADAMHIGCDEAFLIGMCERCRMQPTHILFADYINMLSGHLAEKGVETMMWSDRLLNMEACGHRNRYEAAANGTDGAIDLISRDILCCDWHYEKYDDYRSVDIFADHGFKMMVSPWKNLENARAFLDYAAAHDRGHIEGYLQTTWCSSGELARHYLCGAPLEWHNMPEIVRTLNEIFLSPEVIRKSIACGY